MNDQADGRFIDMQKNITAIAIDMDHGTQPMRGDNDFSRSHSNPMIGQTSAIFPAGHKSFHDVDRVASKLLGAQLDLGIADHHAAGASRQPVFRCRANQSGIIEIRNGDDAVFHRL